MALAAAPAKSVVDFLTQFRWWVGDNTVQIRHKNAKNKILFENEGWSIKGTVEKAAATGVRLGGAYLPQTKLARADLDNLYCASADMTGANLRRSKFRKVIASKTLLEGASMQGVQAAESDLTDAKMGKVKMDYADLYLTDLSRADLTEARMRDVSAIEATLNGATMRGVNAIRSHFSKAKMKGADITDGKFRQAKFMDTDMTDVIARNADLRGCNFRGATTDGMNVEGADLSGTTWSVTTNFNTMKVDSKTKLDNITIIDRHGKPVTHARLAFKEVEQPDGKKVQQLSLMTGGPGAAPNASAQQTGNA